MNKFVSKKELTDKVRASTREAYLKRIRIFMSEYDRIGRVNNLEDR